MTKTQDRRAANSAPDTVIAPGNGRALQVRTARFTSEARRVFLDTLAATCNVSAAQRACGMGITACYRLSAEETDAALTAKLDRLARQMAGHGKAS